MLGRVERPVKRARGTGRRPPRLAGSGRTVAPRSGSLDEQDEGRAGQPAEQGELGRASRRAGRRRPAQTRIPTSAATRLGQAEQDLEGEIAHPVRRPAGPGGRGSGSPRRRTRGRRRPAGRGRSGVTQPTRPSSRSARYIAVASPSSVGLVARMTSSNGSPVGCRLVDALEELADLAAARVRCRRSGRWRRGARGSGPELARALDREDVERLLDDAQASRRRGRRRGRSGTAGASLMLKQRSQNTTSSRTAISALASARASASGARSRW